MLSSMEAAISAAEMSFRAATSASRPCHIICGAARRLGDYDRLSASRPQAVRSLVLHRIVSIPLLAC